MKSNKNLSVKDFFYMLLACYSSQIPVAEKAKQIHDCNNKITTFNEFYDNHISFNDYVSKLLDDPQLLKTELINSLIFYTFAVCSKIIDDITLDSNYNINGVKSDMMQNPCFDQYCNAIYSLSLPRLAQFFVKNCDLKSQTFPAVDEMLATCSKKEYQVLEKGINELLQAA